MLASRCSSPSVTMAFLCRWRLDERSGCHQGICMGRTPRKHRTSRRQDMGQGASHEPSPQSLKQTPEGHDHPTFQAGKPELSRA